VDAAGDGGHVARAGQRPALSIPGGMALYLITDDGTEMIADLWAWEQENSPDQNDPLIGDDNVESNPQDLARIEGATLVADAAGNVDRKSTRLNSSHVKTSYAVFCLKKKT